MDNNDVREESQIFEAFEAVFTGQEAKIRKPKAIERRVVLHQGVSGVSSAIKQHTLKKVCNILEHLLAKKVFQSADQAQSYFAGRLLELQLGESANLATPKAQSTIREADTADDLLHASTEDGEQPKQLGERGKQKRTLSWRVEEKVTSAYEYSPSSRNEHGKYPDTYNCYYAIAGLHIPAFSSSTQASR